jgi:HK97 family phage major capsid protein
LIHMNVDIAAMSAERDELSAQVEVLVEEMAELAEDSAEFKANHELVEELLAKRDAHDVELIKADKLNALSKRANTKAPVAAPAIHTSKGTSMSKVKMDVEPGINAARALRAGLYAHHQRISHEDAALKIFGEDFAAEFKAAQSTMPDSLGGSLIPGEFSRDIVKILKDQTVVRRAGARTLPVKGNTLTIPRGVNAPTAYWVGENAGPNATEVTFGDLVLTPKRLAAQIPISNELLQDADIAVDMYVRDELVAAMALAEDAAFLTGAATDASKPTGLLYHGTSTASGGTTTAYMESDMKGLRGRLMSGMKNQATNPVLLMNPVHVNAMEFARVASTNEVAFPDLRATGKLFGMPIFQTTAIEATSGQIYLVNVPNLVIGETLPLEVSVSREASYNNSAGTLVSAWQNNQTVIQVMLRVDFGVTREEAVQVLTGVSYS